MGINLLIVDDEKRFRESLQNIFQNRDISSAVAADGSEAIEKLNQLSIKVIITDIKMPKVSGFGLLKKAKEIDPHIQFIFLTGYPQLENIKKAFKGDAFEFIAKPVPDYDDLSKTVASGIAKYDELEKKKKSDSEKEKIYSSLLKIFDSFEAIVYISDIQTNELLYTNKKFNIDLGYDENEKFVGKKCWEIVPENRRTPCPNCTNSVIVDDYGQPSEAYVWETYISRAKKHYRIIAKAIEWIDGRIVRLETAYDITQQKKYADLYNEYIKTNENLKRLQSINGIAGGMAHRFNNALAVISGNLDLISLDFSDVRQLSESSKTIREYIEKMARLTRSLLAYAGGGNYQPTEFVFSEFVQDTILQLKLNLPPGIKLITRIPNLNHQIRADRGQIQLLITEIFSNATEAIQKVGTIRICLEDRELPDNPSGNKPSHTAHQKYLCLGISDDGSGVSPEVKESVFEPFFSTRLKGSGLGLSAAYGIVQKHKGHILFKSDPEKGTNVEVFFPVVASDAVADNTDQTKTSKKHLKVLLVEDEEQIRKVLQLLLENVGYDTMGAASGGDAIELLKTHGDNIDIALLDFKLPDMNADKVFPVLKDTHPETEVIILSGHAITESIQNMLDSGARMFLQKPVSIEVLSEKIQEIYNISKG